MSAIEVGDSGNFGANGCAKYAKLPEYAKKSYEMNIQTLS